MVIIEPTDELLSFRDATTVYRGINERQLQRLRLRRGFSPEVPLGKTAEWITLLQSEGPMAHVLDWKRRHFVSFSLRVGTAVWYATAGGKSDGYLCSVQLPSSVRAVIEGGSEPVAYAGCDGTEWVDPRHVFVGAGSFEWSRFHARAVIDQEILLAAGVASVAQIVRVERSHGDARFTPWAETGEKVHML